jgi:hypothetical protein
MDLNCVEDTHSFRELFFSFRFLREIHLGEGLICAKLNFCFDDFPAAQDTCPVLFQILLPSRI